MTNPTADAAKLLAETALNCDDTCTHGFSLKEIRILAAAVLENTRPQPAPTEGELDFDMAKFAMVAKRLIPGDYLTKIIRDDDIRMFQTCAYRASIEHELRNAYRLGLSARPKVEDAKEDRR